MDQKPNEQKNKPGSITGPAVAACIIVGIGIGAPHESVVLGAAIGAALGLAIGAAFNQKKRNYTK